MIIRIKTKTFAENNKKKNGNNSTDDAMRGFVVKLIQDYMRNEKKREHGRPSREESKLNRLKARTKDVDTKIQIQKQLGELGKKEETLNRILNKERPVDKIKETLSNPKVKKGIKIAGLGTLGAGVITGSVIGGVKLKKKLDEKKANRQIKESILEDPKKENKKEDKK